MPSRELKTVLITGSTGFIGSNLTRRFVHDEWRVHVIVKPSSDMDKNAADFDEEYHLRY